MSDELTSKELRDGLASLGKLELEFMNVEQEIINSSPALLDLHSHLEKAFDGEGEFSLTKEQSKLVFLCVRFSSIHKTLSRAQTELETFVGQ